MINNHADLYLNTRIQSKRAILFGICLPMAIGLGICVLNGLVLMLGYHYSLRIFEHPLDRWLPYLMSLTLFSLFVICCILIANGKRIFSKRYSIAVILLIISCMLTGINLGPLDPADLAFITVFISWVTFSLVERRAFYSPLPITCLLLGLTAFLFSSIINGGFISILTLHTLVTKIILFFLIINIITSNQLHRLAIKSFIICSFLSALVGIFSEFIYYQFDYNFTFWDIQKFQFKETLIGKMLRVTAFLPTSQGLGHLLILASSLVLFIPLSRKRRIFYLLILATCLAFTFSMGAYIVLAVVLILSVFIRKPERSIQYAMYFLAIVFFAYISGGFKWIYKNVFMTLGAASGGDRIILIRAGLDILRRHPFLGIGLKNFGKAIHLPIHNTYMQIAAEIGIFGGTIFVVIVLYLTINIGILIRKLQDPELKNWMRGLFLGMIGLSLHFLVEPFYDNIISWLYMGLVASAIVIYSKRPLNLGNAYEQ